MLLAFPLVGRRAIVTGLLLLLLTELQCELLDLLVLLDAVAPGVVHWAPRTLLITVGGLEWSLVAAWVVAPTSHYCDSSGSGSTCHRLVVVVGLLPLPTLVLATALSSSISFGLPGLPYLWSRLGAQRRLAHCVWPTSRASSHVSHPVEKQQQQKHWRCGGWCFEPRRTTG
jgi:hypothetical protein